MRSLDAVPLVIAILMTAPVQAGVAQDGELSGAGFTRGDSAASLTVVEFGDFGCSACAQFATETFHIVDAEFVQTGRVRWRFIPFVLGPFRHSKQAAMAAVCAGEQDAFWAMHDLLFDRRDGWMSPRDPRPVFEEFARQLDLETLSFAECYKGDDVEDRVKDYTKLARRLGVRATPTFFVRDQPVLGALPADAFRRVLEEALAR